MLPTFLLVGIYRGVQ